MPSVFQSGFNFSIGLPLMLHNRFFARHNNYTDLGYQFLYDEGTSDLALPIDTSMFEYMMGAAQNWGGPKQGLAIYEQDWLITVWEGMNITRSNVTAAHSWLMAMNNAAVNLGITIQYCMPLPNFMLHSTLTQAVTNARASGDYRAGRMQTNVGQSSLLYWALGVAPSKDTWWSSEFQPGNPQYGGAHEPNYILQAVVVALSTGPNQPGDMVGAANASNIMSTCNSEGLTLKPARPSIVLDTALLAAVDGHPVPDVRSAWDEMFPGGPRTSYITAQQLAAPFTLAAEDLGGASVSFALIDWFNPMGGAVGVLIPGGTTYAIPVGTGQPSAPAEAAPFRFLVAAPALPGPNGGQWVFYGEAGKVTTVSGVRFGRITWGDSLVVPVKVGAGEAVTLIVGWFRGPVAAGALVMSQVVCEGGAGAQVMTATCTSTCACV